MKKPIVLMLPLIFFPILAHAQTIEDMYFDLPSELVGQLQSPDEPKDKDKAFRKLSIKTVDRKNGFLETKGGVHFAKFVRKKSSPLLVVAGGSYAEDGRKVRIQTFTKNAKNVWEDVTKSYTPEVPRIVIDAFHRNKCKSKNGLSDSASGTYRYMLPREGKVIRAIVSGDGATCGQDLFRLTFDGSRFVFDYE